MAAGIDREIVRESIEHYGAAMQTVVCMEECGELIQAISKTIRMPNISIPVTNLEEEMADVMICLVMLQEIYGIPDERIEGWIKDKQQRITERMRKGI